MKRFLIVALLFLVSIILALAFEVRAANEKLISPKAAHKPETQTESRAEAPSVISAERNDSGYWPYNVNTIEGITLRGVSGAPPVYPRSSHEDHSPKKEIDEE